MNCSLIYRQLYQLTILRQEDQQLSRQMSHTQSRPCTANLSDEASNCRQQRVKDRNKDRPNKHKISQREEIKVSLTGLY